MKSALVTTAVWATSISETESFARCQHGDRMGTQAQLAKEGVDDGGIWSGVTSLWEEIIEMSTYGPGERAMLKLKRKKMRAELEEEQGADVEDGGSSEGRSVFDQDSGDDAEWLAAFTAAKESSSGDDSGQKLDYDGYKLNDLITSRWGVPLDVDFQLMNESIYCTVLPVRGYGGNILQSRHETELSYLMHLQGIVEVLHKYDQLDDFVEFVETTKKIPKRGTDSVPYRLNLSKEEIDKIVS